MGEGGKSVGGEVGEIGRVELVGCGFILSGIGGVVVCCGYLDLLLWLGGWKGVFLR